MMRFGRRLASDERGISTVIVAVSLLAIFGGTLLSVDFGSALATRRRLIQGTDSTALDQARLAGIGGPAAACLPGGGGVVAWQDYLLRNVGTYVAGSDQCNTYEDPAFPGTGYVVVEARKFADTRFGGLFGFGGDTQPYSLSAAQYGYVEPEGLRPMAFCVENDHVEQWLAFKNWERVLAGGTADPNYPLISETDYNGLKDDLDVGTRDDFPPTADADVYIDGPLDLKIDYPQGSATNGLGGTSYASYGTIHRMYFTKTNPDECATSSDSNGVPGNWGWMDFDGGSNNNNPCGPNPGTQCWVEEGYDGQVGVNDCDGDYNPGPPATGEQGDACSGDPGFGGGSSASELDYLVENEIPFAIPIFNEASDNGANAQLSIWGFLVLKLRGFKLTGQASEAYFDFEFSDTILSGNCCLKTTGQSLGAPKGVRICGVDHDGETTDAIIAARCGM